MWTQPNATHKDPTSRRYVFTQLTQQTLPRAPLTQPFRSYRKGCPRGGRIFSSPALRANLSLEKVYRDSLGGMVVRRESKAGRPFVIGTFVQEMEAKVATTRRKHPPRPWFKLLTSGTSGTSPPVMSRSPRPEGP